MINPKNTFVGIGTFINYSGARFSNCTAGEFSSKNINDSIVSTDDGECIRIIELKKEYIDSPVIMYSKKNNVYSEDDLKDEKLSAGSILECNMYYKVAGSDGSGYVFDTGVTWSS